MDKTEKIGNVVSGIRKENNFTQERFAEKVLGISMRHLRRIEKGESELSLEQFIKIANFFEMDVHRLINRIELSADGETILAKFYRLVDTPTPPNEIVIRLKEVYDLFDNSEKKLTPYERTTFEMVESFILYKENKDLNYLKYFVDNNMDYVEKNLRALELLIPLLSVNDLLELALELPKKFKHMPTIKASHVEVSLYSNIIGYLLNHKYHEAEAMETIFSRFKESIKVSNEYLQVVTYYRHRCWYHRFRGEKELEEEAKNCLLNMIEFVDDNIKEQLIFDLEVLETQ